MPSAIMFAVVSWPADQQQACHQGQFALGQFTGADLLDGEPGKQVVAGVGELVGDQAVQVVIERVLGLPGHLGRGVPVDQELAGALEEVVVGVGHAEQVADHQGGHGQGESLHQVDRGGAGQHLVDQVVHDPLDRRAQRLDPLDRERGGHHPAQPGMLGVVHVDECRRLHPESVMRAGAGVWEARQPASRS